jgi:hypothetical protein
MVPDIKGLLHRRFALLKRLAERRLARDLLAYRLRNVWHLAGCTAPRGLLASEMHLKG